MLHINSKLMQQLDGVEFAYSKDRMSAASDVFGDPGLAHFIEIEPLSLGCDIIFSRADFGSTSHKNMEKSGLPMAYTRAVWKRAT